MYQQLKSSHSLAAVVRLRPEPFLLEPQLPVKTPSCQSPLSHGEIEDSHLALSRFPKVNYPACNSVDSRTPECAWCLLLSFKFLRSGSIVVATGTLADSDDKTLAVGLETVEVKIGSTRDLALSNEDFLPRVHIRTFQPSAPTLPKFPGANSLGWTVNPSKLFDLNSRYPQEPRNESAQRGNGTG